ncbi:MAG: DUF3788 domain-containing protein [Dehalococcoidia bacterium]|nr:DUF3788 domain-containing protein [Dehalococcoidia bacterium]
MSDRPLLCEPEIPPSEQRIADALKGSYHVYQKFVDSLPEKKIDLGWRYYNDTKAWLAKGTFRKTVFWLSIWDGFFRISLYFTEKTRDGIQALPVSRVIKQKIAREPAIGKLIPLILELSSESQLANATTLIEYKQKLK